MTTAIQPFTQAEFRQLFDKPLPEPSETVGDYLKREAQVMRRNVEIALAQGNRVYKSRVARTAAIVGELFPDGLRDAQFVLGGSRGTRRNGLSRIEYLLERTEMPNAIRFLERLRVVTDELQCGPLGARARAVCQLTQARHLSSLEGAQLLWFFGRREINKQGAVNAGIALAEAIGEGGRGGLNFFLMDQLFGVQRAAFPQAAAHLQRRLSNGALHRDLAFRGVIYAANLSLHRFGQLVFNPGALALGLAVMVGLQLGLATD